MDAINLSFFLHLDLPAFEPINVRRGGWSGIARVSFADQAFFVKRQVNHTFRDPRRLGRSTPTLRREYRSMLRLQKIGIRVPEMIMYTEDGCDAMLVTRELDGFVDLDTYLANAPAPQQRSVMLQGLLSTLLRMHSQGYNHGCLYGKHVMVRTAEPADNALIDLEKLRFSPLTKNNAVRDLSQLFRYSASLDDNDRTMILGEYEPRFPGITRLLAARAESKLKPHD